MAEKTKLVPEALAAPGDLMRTGIRRQGRRQKTWSLVDHIVRVEYVYGSGERLVHVHPLCGSGNGRASLSDTDELCKTCERIAARDGIETKKPRLP